MSLFSELLIVVDLCFHFVTHDEIIFTVALFATNLNSTSLESNPCPFSEKPLSWAAPQQLHDATYSPDFGDWIQTIRHVFEWNKNTYHNAVCYMNIRNVLDCCQPLNHINV